MNKYLIEVFVPSISTTYDIFISRNCMVYELLKLIADAIEKLSAGRFKNKMESVLCNRNTGEILDINAAIEDVGIKDGTQLLLI